MLSQGYDTAQQQATGVTRLSAAPSAAYPPSNGYASHVGKAASRNYLLLSLTLFLEIEKDCLTLHDPL